MNIYLVTYDLIAPGKNYQNLWNALKNLGATRALESVWVLKSNQNGPTIFDTLVVHMDANDRLLVTKMEDWKLRTALMKINEL